ncbi:hypothetical protein [Streptomyces kaempferi]|uniref:Uncharacterized protein n=1 Tax=Streptomyces kaempferi TaxID=333725 RepID=A0ABW3XKY7_9ACTN
MTQQISYDEAFPTLRRRCSELFEANLLLEVKVDVLERRVKELEAAPAPEPGSGDATPLGPDLAAQPPYPDDQRA